METQGIDDKMLVETQLLTAEEKAMCEKIVALNESPHSQRAAMLLALDAGETQAKSATQAGISIGHLKYWLKKFRETRLAIFPSVLQESFDLALTPSIAVSDEKTESPQKIEKVKKVAKKPKKSEKKKNKKAKEVKEKKNKELKKKKDAKKKVKKNDKAGKKQKKSKKDKKKSKNKKAKK